VRILTYNIAGNRGRKKPGHLEKVAELILKSRADLVGLQEVIHVPDNGPPPEEILAAETGMHAYFLPAHVSKNQSLGNAVLCREPISETISHELPHSWPERRVLLEVETCVAGLPVTVFCTHLVHMARAASRLRLAQATAVAKCMTTCWRPHILVGDLNAGPRSRELHPVRKICVRHDHLHGIRSWPARRPLILYDHIWPGPGWAVESVEILDLHVSDHRPVLAQLGWMGAPRYWIMPDERYLHPPGK
jgi:endonuclease/exonuclease/phosphatase family metal-dependent hydrolase